MCRTKISTDSFIIRSNNIHNNIYSYNRAIYTGSLNKIVITCLTHGDFLQNPHTHLRGQGCPKCWDKNRSLTKEEFIERAILKHDFKYDYSNSQYTDTRNIINIYCKKHGEFYIKAKSHLDGRGCRECWLEKNKLIIRNKTSGWSKAEYCKMCGDNTYIYILDPKNENFIKVGITKNFKIRYQCKNDFPYDYDLLLLKKGECNKIFDLELKIKKLYKLFKIKPNKQFKGKTECYDKNIMLEILNLINDEK